MKQSPVEALLKIIDQGEVDVRDEGFGGSDDMP